MRLKGKDKKVLIGFNMEVISEGNFSGMVGVEVIVEY